MTASNTNANQLVEQLAEIDGVIRDDIEVIDDAVTTYIPTGKLKAAAELDGVNVEVLEEYEHEYLISVSR
jgi:hypothetical protein